MKDKLKIARQQATIKRLRAQVRRLKKELRQMSMAAMINAIGSGR